jgi:quinol monooxygenase YgiN
MLKVVAKLILKPGAKDAVIEIARELVEKTRLEAGNISYSLNADVNDPSVVAFIEEWQSQEVLDEHMASEHFTRIFPLLAEQAAEQVISIFAPLI